MTFHRSLDVIRRWRLVIVAGVLIGAVVGWLSAPGAAETEVTFEATHTMILDPSARDRTMLNRAAVMATLGAVPDRVAARLNIDGEAVRSRVSAGTRDSVGQLVITGRSADSAQAGALADFTAEELVAELGGANAPLRTLEPAVAEPVKTDDITGPTSRPGRAALLGAFGLVLGVGAAFGVERFDNRLRSRQAVEDALGLPVVGEVPRVPRSSRDRLVTPAESATFIEAYRGLRTTVDRWTSQAGEGSRGPVIVVTSPLAGEGKTVTVAHLASALAELGRSVVAISADLRRPGLHRYFDRPREPGLAEVLRGAPGTRRLTDLNLATAVRGVFLVASGAPVDNPSPLLDRIGDHLDVARGLGDSVLVDAPPLLTTSDGAVLAGHADGVLLVVRAGRTSVAAAARSAELLERLGIPVIGVVLCGTDALAVRT